MLEMKKNIIKHRLKDTTKNNQKCTQNNSRYRFMFPTMCVKKINS